MATFVHGYTPLNGFLEEVLEESRRVSENRMQKIVHAKVLMERAQTNAAQDTESLTDDIVKVVFQAMAAQSV